MILKSVLMDKRTHLIHADLTEHDAFFVQHRDENSNYAEQRFIFTSCDTGAP